MWRTVLRSTWLITQGFARRMQNGEAYAFFHRRFIQLIGLVFALLAVLCVIPCGCMVFPLKVHGFRAVIDSLSNMKRVKYAPLQ